MAKVKDIFGNGISGKVGQMVFYRYRGKICVRALSGTKNKTSTEKQVRQRVRFAGMMKFALRFKFIVIPQIWNQASKELSGFQYFMKINKAAFNDQGKVEDVKLIQLSTGKLDLPFDLKAQRQGEGSVLIEVSWMEDRNLGGVPYRDQLMAISYGGDDYSKIKSTDICRGHNHGTFELPELACPATHLFLFFSSLERRNYSGSMCFELN